MSESNIPQSSNEAWPLLLWAAIGTAVSQAITHLAQQEFVSTLIAALITATLFIALNSQRKISALVKRRPVWGYVIGSVFILAIVASPFIAERRWPFSEPTFISELVPPAEQSVLNSSSLEDLFQNDKPPGVYRTPGSMNLTNSDGTQFSAELASFTDPHNGAQWLEVYIPRTPMTLDIVKKILADNQTILEKLAPKGALQMFAKGQYGQESTAAVRFTGKLIIYHEKLFSAQEYADAETAAKAANINLLLRNPAFASR